MNLNIDKKALEDKLKKTLKEIKENDGFLYSYLDKIHLTIKNTITPTSNHEVSGVLPYQSVEDSIYLVGEFLEKCTPEYKAKIIEDYRRGKIIIHPSLENYTQCNVKTKDYKMFIRRTDTLTQSIYLVHENMHTKNINDYIMRLALGETVSIAGELMFIDYLRKKQNRQYNEYNLNFLVQERGKIYKDNLLFLKLTLPLLISIKETGEIDNSFLDMAIEGSELTSQQAETTLNRYIKDPKSHWSVYRHTLGYILAKSFVDQHQNPADLKTLNDLLRDAKFTEFQQMAIGTESIVTVGRHITKDEFSYHDTPHVKILK